MALTTVNTGDVITASQHNEIQVLLKTTTAKETITFTHKGADIASAGTLSLGSDGNYFHVTGTTGITAFSTLQAGTMVVLEFDGAVTLTHNATSLILQGAANITTAAGDVLIFISEGSGNWRQVGWVSAAGFVTLTGTQTLTNKTLTSPVINTQLTGTAVSTAAPAAVGTAAAGTATTIPHSDHVHATGAGTPSTQAFGDAAAIGTGPAAAMTDHKHAMMANPVSYAIPSATLTIGGSAVVGSASSAIRSDGALAISGQVGATGLTWATDNTYDIGASGANRPRSVYFGTALIGPGTVATTGTLRIADNTVIVVAKDDGGTDRTILEWGITLNNGLSLYDGIGGGLKQIGTRTTDGTGHLGVSQPVWTAY